MRARRLRNVLIVLAGIGIALAGYLTYLHYSGTEVPCSIKGNPCEAGAALPVLRARRHPGRPARSARLHRHPRNTAGARNRDLPVRHRGHHSRRVRLQRLPHLPRDLHARKNLRVVRRQRDPADDHDAALAVAVPAAREHRHARRAGALRAGLRRRGAWATSPSPLRRFPRPPRGAAAARRGPRTWLCARTHARLSSIRPVTAEAPRIRAFPADLSDRDVLARPEQLRGELAGRPGPPPTPTRGHPTRGPDRRPTAPATEASHACSR